MRLNIKWYCANNNFYRIGQNFKTKSMNLRNFLIVVLSNSIFFSCSKNTGTTINTFNVSGKLKSIVKTTSGTSPKTILTVKYDLLNRVVDFNNWHVDSSYSPPRISYAAYRNFKYNGSDQFPSNSTTTNESGSIDSAFYYYDNSNKLVRSDGYSGNGLQSISKYNYINNNLIVLIDSTYDNGIPSYSGTDSLFLYEDKSLKTFRFYDRLGSFVGSFSYSYDDQQSPFYQLNIFKYLYLIIGDLDVGYNSMHNFITFRRVAFGTTDHIINQSYNFSSNSFPISARGSETYNVNLFGYLDFSIEYTYY